MAVLLFNCRSIRRHFLPRTAQGIVHREELQILTKLTLDKLHADQRVKF
ncbi:hypothetical protein [Kingella negevensis]|nr:hypothetical protein [Kingella negevensis]MDK4689418.1 hypothetical protein [Kingella negevensis]WII90146.1 hypothetical protein QEO93_06570 [Kingella negevensis]